MALASLLLLLMALFSPYPELRGESSLQVSGERQVYIQLYEIYDIRYCHITPAPFICQRCLRAKKQFARRLSFEPDGRPVREYICLEWQDPYRR